MWTCEMCFSGGQDYGEILPGLSVVHTVDDNWILLGGQGHRGDHIVVFTEAPTPDPVTPETWEQAELKEIALTLDQVSASLGWIATVEAQNFFQGWTARTIWRFVNKCVQHGYDPDDGDVESWLYERAGEMVATGEFTELVYVPVDDSEPEDIG